MDEKNIEHQMNGDKQSFLYMIGLYGWWVSGISFVVSITGVLIWLLFQ